MRVEEGVKGVRPSPLPRLRPSVSGAVALDRPIASAKKAHDGRHTAVVEVGRADVWKDGPYMTL
jgi:hypothetical protein